MLVFKKLPETIEGSPSISIKVAFTVNHMPKKRGKSYHQVVCKAKKNHGHECMRLKTYKDYTKLVNLMNDN